MAQNKMLKAFALFQTEHAIEVVDELYKFLNETVELDAAWEGYFSNFKEQLKSNKTTVIKAAKQPKADKPKREPTAYNIYIREQMATLKESKPELNAKERMKLASAAWKEHSAAAPAAPSDEKPKVSDEKPKVSKGKK